MLSKTLLAAFAALLAFIAPLTDAKCSKFTVVNSTHHERYSNVSVPYLYEASMHTYRVSPDVVCHANKSSHSGSRCLSHTCQIQTHNGTVIRASGTTNATHPPPPVDIHQWKWLFELVGKKLGIPFPVEASTTIGHPNSDVYSLCIPVTEAGHLTFTPGLNCAQGILSGCDGKSPGSVNGHRVKVCAPAVRGKNSQLQGAVFLKRLAPATASKPTASATVEAIAQTAAADRERSEVLETGSEA